MSKDEAARILGIAEWEVVEVRDGAALVHDSASHEETWRRLTSAQPAGKLDATIRRTREDLAQLAEEFDAVGDLDGDGVPDGTAAEVLAWVGDDPDKAGAALVAESARDKPRSTLIAALEKLAA